MSDPERPAGNRRVSPAPAGAESGTPQVELVAEALPQPTLTRRRRPGWWLPAGLLLLVTLILASWLALPIRQVSISGEQQLSQAQVKALAGLEPLRGIPFGWLYYGTWRARGLLSSPWVQSAEVIRRFPDAVTVKLIERRPVARWVQRDGKILALAVDGTVMPGARGLERLPLVQGWGPERLADALKVLGALSGYNVQSVAYSPAGLSVKVGTATVWSGDLDSFLKYAGSIAMYPNKNISIYPWGVSVQE